MRLFLQCSLKFNCVSLLFVTFFLLNIQVVAQKNISGNSNKSQVANNGSGGNEAGIINITDPLPSSLTKCQGEALMLSISATSDSLLTYTWKKNGTALPGSSPVFTIASLGIGDTGTYSVEIKENNTSNISTSSCYVFVNLKPIITSHPTGMSPICEGDSIVLTSQIQNGLLVWKKDGSNIYIGDTFKKLNATLADTGNYSILVKANLGCRDTVTNPFKVIVKKPAAITTQPVSAALRTASNLSHIFRVKTSGTGPFAYQWYKDGFPIGGANADTFKIFNFITSIDSGTYYVEIISPTPCNATIQSSLANLSPTLCPIYLSTTINGKLLNANDTVFKACLGGPLFIEVKSVGASGYQWIKGGLPLASATTFRYGISNVTDVVKGYYSLELLSDPALGCIQTTTPPVRVDPLPGQVITLQPVPNEKCNATSHILTTAANNTMSYQWFLNGSPIAGATGNSYTVATVDATPQSYSVQAINDYCPALTSNTVLVRQIDPNTMIATPNMDRSGLLAQCTDDDNWTYYAHPDNLFEMLIAIRKNGNTVKFNPEIKYNLGILEEVKPSAIERRGILMGVRRMFNINVDTPKNLTNSYDVKFFYTNEEQNLFLNAINVAYDIYSYSSSLPINELSFLVSTQKDMDANLINGITSPLNFDNALVTDKKFGKASNFNFVEINKLVAAKGGGAFYFDYYNYKGAASVKSPDLEVSVSLFPVPSSGNITIDYNSKNKKDVSMMIYDYLGKQVGQYILNGKQNLLKLDLSYLSNGNYVVRFDNELHNVQTKITIAK